MQRLKHFYTPSGYSSWSAGENLLYNSAAMDANEAIQIWLDSPPHRQNMLDPTWREVGIGSLHATSAGGTFGGGPTWVITMDFGMRTGGATAPKPAAIVKTAAAHKTVATKTKKAKRTTKAGKVTKASRMVARVNHLTKQLVHNAKPKHAFKPPLEPRNARPGHETKSKVNSSEKGESKPKQPAPKKPIRILPDPAPSAPSVPVPTGPDTDAATRHHYGDDEQGMDEGTDDPGTPPDAAPAPSS